MKLFQKIVGVVGVLCLVLGVVRLCFTPAALAGMTAPPAIVITETAPADPNPVGVNATFGGTLEVNPTDSKGHKEDFPGDTEIIWKVLSVTKDGTPDNSLISQINPGGDSQTASYSGSFTNGGKYEIQFQATVSNDSWSPKSIDAQHTVTVKVVPFIITTPDRYICVGKTKTFSASGGLTPYQWSTEDVNLLKVETIKNQGVVTAIGGGGGKINLGAVIMVTDNTYPAQVAAHKLIIVDTTLISKQIDALIADIGKQQIITNQAVQTMILYQKIVTLDEAGMESDLSKKKDLNSFITDLKATHDAADFIDTAASVLAWFNKFTAKNVTPAWIISEFISMVNSAAFDFSFEEILKAMQELLNEVTEDINQLKKLIPQDIETLEGAKEHYYAAMQALQKDGTQLASLERELEIYSSYCDQ